MNPRLLELGACVEVATCDSPTSPWLELCEFPIHALGPGHTKYAYCPKLLHWLQFNFDRFDAVIIHGLWQHHGPVVRHVLYGTDTPYYVYTHGMLDPWFGKRYPLKHLKKWSYWPWAEYRVLRDARAVLFTSEEERVRARESFWLYKANEVVAGYGTETPPTVTPDRFLSEFPKLAGQRIVLFVGRLHQKKGCDLLLSAFAEVAAHDPHLELVMVGADETRWAAHLKAHAAQLGIGQRVTWTGLLQGDVKWSAFHAAEVVCLPSHQENFGIVVAEALGCGKPVLISNKVNIWREIAADEAGFVDEDTVEGTVRNLRRWLALEACNYSFMKSQAQLCFSSRFHIGRAAEHLLQIIKEHAQ